jgi:hypothetical protein
MAERLFSAFMGGFFASLILAAILIGLIFAQDYFSGNKQKDNKESGKNHE